MIWRVWSVKPYVKFHHLKQLEQLKSEPTGSFLILSIHLSFEEIIADLNSANPTSTISLIENFIYFLSIFTKFKLFGDRNVTILLYFSIDVKVLDRFSRNERYPLKIKKCLVI